MKSSEKSQAIRLAQLEQLLSIHGPTLATTSLLAVIVAYTMWEVIDELSS